jgi:hypothetical protein
MDCAFERTHPKKARVGGPQKEEKKELRERCRGPRKALIVRMNRLVSLRVKRLAKNSPALAKSARMGHPNSF